MNKVHQRCVGDRLCATRVGDRHEVFEQRIVFCVVPVNIYVQVSVGAGGHENKRTNPRGPQCIHHRTCLRGSRSGGG